MTNTLDPGHPCTCCCKPAFASNSRHDRQFSESLRMRSTTTSRPQYKLRRDLQTPLRQKASRQIHLVWVGSFCDKIRSRVIAAAFQTASNTSLMPAEKFSQIGAFSLVAALLSDLRTGTRDKVPHTTGTCRLCHRITRPMAQKCSVSVWETSITLSHMFVCIVSNWNDICL